MGWARFDDNYTDHPKIRDAGPWAELLDMRAIIYCARFNTDGYITKIALGQIARRIPKPLDKVDRLVTVGRWTPLTDSSWMVQGFLEYNTSKAERDRLRAMGRERQNKYRQRNGVTGSPVTRNAAWGITGVTSGGDARGGSPIVTRCADCGRLDLDCDCT